MTPLVPVPQLLQGPQVKLGALTQDIGVSMVRWN